MKKCNSCGAILADDNRFCNECGSADIVSILEEPAAQPVSAPSPTPSPAPQTPADPRADAPQPPYPAGGYNQAQGYFQQPQAEPGATPINGSYAGGTNYQQPGG